MRLTQSPPACNDCSIRDSLAEPCVCGRCAYRDSSSQEGTCHDSTGTPVQELCGEHGRCSSSTGKCVCSGGFSGDYCSTPDPQRLCGTPQWPARLQRVQEACPVGAATIAQGTGHRRAQTANAACASLNSRMDAVNEECCNEATEDCSTGIPTVCNANCKHNAPFSEWFSPS